MLAMTDVRGELLTLRDAAERFKVSIHTLRYWRELGVLSKWRQGRIVMVDSAEVQRELQRRQQPRRENGDS